MILVFGEITATSRRSSSVLIAMHPAVGLRSGRARPSATAGRLVHWPTGGTGGCNGDPPGLHTTRYRGRCVARAGQCGGIVRDRPATRAAAAGRDRRAWCRPPGPPGSSCGLARESHGSGGRAGRVSGRRQSFLRPASILSASRCVLSINCRLLFHARMLYFAQRRRSRGSLPGRSS